MARQKLLRWLLVMATVVPAAAEVRGYEMAALDLGTAEAGAILPGSTSASPLQPGRGRARAPTTVGEYRLPAPFDPRPRTVDSLPRELKAALRLGFHEAHRRLATLPGCRTMFAELGADGAELLRLSLYAPVTAHERRRTCGGAQAMAFTWHRNPVVKLCPVFARTTVPRSAAALLHEALHLAGLSERPRDPEGMSSHEIDRMVAERCGVR